jgi:hypothetical protein
MLTPTFHPEAYAKMMLLENKIELLLNPEREQHRELITLAHDLVSLLHQTKRQVGEKQFIDRKANIELSITALASRLFDVSGGGQKCFCDEWPNQSLQPTPSRLVSFPLS